MMRRAGIARARSASRQSLARAVSVATPVSSAGGEPVLAVPVAALLVGQPKVAAMHEPGASRQAGWQPGSCRGHESRSSNECADDPFWPGVRSGTTASTTTPLRCQRLAWAMTRFFS